MKRLRVGIVGCGAMGSQIARACRMKLSRAVDLTAVCDIDESKVFSLNSSLKKSVRALKLDELIKKVDLVVESSSAHASAGIVEKCRS